MLTPMKMNDPYIRSGWHKAVLIFMVFSLLFAALALCSGICAPCNGGCAVIYAILVAIARELFDLFRGCVGHYCFYKLITTRLLDWNEWKGDSTAKF